MEGAVTYDGDMIKLTTDNYFYSKTVMDDHLICEGISEPILNEDMPGGKNESELKLLNRKVIVIIQKYIDRVCLSMSQHLTMHIYFG